MTTVLARGWVDDLTNLPPDERHAWIQSLTEAQADILLHEWRGWARPDQIIEPGDWRVWLILAGRGWGKTRTGAEWVREQVKSYPLVNIIGATADDARDIMIEGESGILSVCPDHERPAYLVSKRRLEWPNGAQTLIFTAAEPERLRGKQHMKLWADEVGAWRYPEAFDQAMFGLRLGNNPQVVVTTTPRPTALIRDLLARPGTVVRRGSTYDNRDNLAEAFYTDIIRKYEGTRLGRQELNAELLTDTPGALWTRDLIRLNRAVPDLARVVVAVDPSGGDEPENDEVGIVAAGRGKDQRGYILADHSARYSPDGWARKAVAVFDDLRADRIVAEANFGGAMVESTLRTVRRDLPITLVHASRGKAIRAEPIAALYEQGKVDHAQVFPELEDELCVWTPLDKKSPNRLDALVWAMTDLFRRQGEPSMAFQDGVRI
jgi:phage terminase large subunit-like protein